MKNQRTVVFALFAASAAWQGLIAQTTGNAAQNPAAAPSVEEEVLQLSPFEVTSDSDTGYQATETLAGTRIRTDLRDVGSAISVITKEFMQDIGATDSSTLLQYTTNAEVAGTRGTYAGLGNGTSVDESGTLRAPAGAQRVRGLAAADNTRDFFTTDIPWDSYNVDRIDIQRGPNSILFGLGSPAGIVNASLRNAEFRNKGSVEYRVGSYGSQRASIDVNQVLIKDVLSIRLDGLWNNEKYQQSHAFQNDRRLYGAVRFEPQLFKDPSFHTTIKAKYEHGDIKANRPRTVTPNDNISAWFRPREVTADNPFGGMGKAVANNAYDPWRNDNVVAGNGYGMVIAGSANYSPWLADMANQQQPIYTIDGTTGQTFRVFGGWINAGARNNSGGFTGASAGIIGKRTNGMLYAVGGLPGAAVGLNLPGASFGQYRQQSLLDPTIFDFYNNLIDGPNKGEWEKWNAYNLSIAQTGWGDRVGVELSYDRQNYYRGGWALLGGAPSISIDIMRNFADYYPPENDPTTPVTTNPNFGRAFVSSTNGGGGSSYRSEREYYRASLFGELRARDFFDKDGFLTKLLGKHRFNAVGSREKYFTESRGWQEYANSREWAGYWNGTDGTGSPINDRGPVSVIYLGGSLIGLPSASGANIPGIATTIKLADPSIYVFDPTWVNFSVPFNGAYTVPSSRVRVQNPSVATTQAANLDNYRGWSYYNTYLMRYNNGEDLSLLTRAQKSLRETISYASSWQGYWWNDTVVTTLGWRYDEVKGKAVNAVNMGTNRNILYLGETPIYNPADTSKVLYAPYVLPSDYPASQIFKDHSTSGSVVVHVNRLFGNKDPLPINVSLSYNKSNNFQVTDTRRNIYGTPIGNPTGSTKDYGVLLSTKDGKYSLRAVKYETSVANASSGISDPGGIGRIIQQGLRFRNVFLYDLGAYDWATRAQPQGRNTWGGSTTNGDPVNGADQNLTAAQGRALEDSAIKTWNEIQAWLTDKGFFNAWGFQPQALSVLTDRSTYEAAMINATDPAPQYAPNPASIFAYVATPPPGFTVTADTQSKGYEFELVANPIKNWRIAFNASETTAVRRNVGGAELDEFIAFIDSKLRNADGSLTPAGAMPQFGNTTLNLYANVYGPWRSNYVQMKLQEGAAAPEIRKWRYNIVTNYTFTDGFLKNVGVGGSYRWQDKVIIGYPTTANGTFDLSQPYYGPSEDAIDLWTSYERKLNNKVKWKIQLNIRNAFAKEGLIPISIEPDGHTWASVRVKPVQEWFVTNTFSF